MPLSLRCASTGCWSAWRKIRREDIDGSAKKFLALSWRQRRLLGQALLWLIAAELALRFCPRRAVRRFLNPSVDPNVLPQLPAKKREIVEDLARMITIADLHGAFSPCCLRRSLAMAWWLRRRGIGATIKIGVAKQAHELRAHAWLTANDPQPMPLFEEAAFLPLDASGLCAES